MIVTLLIIVGTAVIFFFVILIKNIAAPKRAGQLAQLYKQGRIAPATKIARQILVKEPRNPDAHYYLGLCYLADSKPELALMELKAVDQIGIFEGVITEITFRNTIADLYLRFNQYEEAQKEYLLLIQLEPENSEYYYLAGKLFELREHPEKAVKYYKKTIELDKRHADAYARLGNILYRAKKLPEAKAALEQSIRLQPGNAIGSYYLGKIFKESKDFQTALQYFEKSLKDTELKIKSLVERGTCFISLGDLVRAESELERALKQGAPDDAMEIIHARYLLAYCYEQARKFDEAIEQWKKIQSKKPNFRDVPAKLANYLDLQADDKMKDFLTSSDEKFLDICKGIVMSFDQTVQDIKAIESGYEIIAGDSPSKFRNTKKLPTIFRFLRVTDIIEELQVRTFYEGLKTNQIRRGVMISSSLFSHGAKEFAESRPLDLIDKEKLQKLLEQIKTS